MDLSDGYNFITSLTPW